MKEDVTEGRSWVVKNTGWTVKTVPIIGVSNQSYISLFLSSLNVSCLVMPEVKSWQNMPPPPPLVGIGLTLPPPVPASLLHILLNRCTTPSFTTISSTRKKMSKHTTTKHPQKGWYVMWLANFRTSGGILLCMAQKWYGKRLASWHLIRKFSMMPPLKSNCGHFKWCQHLIF